MAKFCGKCGTPLNETTGLCPNCSSKATNKTTATSKKEKKRLEKQQKKKNRTFIQRFFRLLKNIIVIPILLIVITGLLLFGLTYFRIISIPSIEDVLYKLNLDYDSIANKDVDALLDEYMVEPIDVDTYYKEFADVVSVTSVDNFATVMSEKAAREFLDERGFDSLPLETDYTEHGEYSGITVIEEPTDIKHPIYNSVFVSEQGIRWNLTLIGNNIVAVPNLYGTEYENDITNIYSEFETVLSYDSSSNSYYELHMKSEEYRLTTVSQINYELLNSISIEEMTQHD